MPKCPMSEMALHSLKVMSESYDILINSAQRLEQSELASKAQKRLAWRRAEHVGRAIDNLLTAWEQEYCPALFYSCVWEQTQRNLSVINTLTPFNQWDCPQFIRFWQAAQSAQSAQQTQSEQTAAPPETEIKE